MDEREKQLNKLHSGFLREKMDDIMNSCYSRCTERSRPGSSVTGRQVTCIGTPLLT